MKPLGQLRGRNSVRDLQEVYIVGSTQVAPALIVGLPLLQRVCFLEKVGSVVMLLAVVFEGNTQLDTIAIEFHLISQFIFKPFWSSLFPRVSG
jgi:hypothetical protein